MKTIISLCMLLICFNTALFSKTFNSNNPNRRNVYQQQDSLMVLDYVFKDLLGNDVRISDFKGKIVLIDLWYSGCGACITCNESLKYLHKLLISKNIVFLSISVDSNKQKWMQSITKNAVKSELNPWAGKYYPAVGTVTLYCGENGGNNAFIRKYNPNNYYPLLMLIDTDGRIISKKLPRPETEPEKLIEIITAHTK